MSVGSIIARGNGTGCDSPDPDRRLRAAPASAPPAAGSARSRSPSRRPAPTSPTWPAAAERDGDGWVVNGTKRWVGHATVGRLHPPAGPHPSPARRPRALRRPRAVPDREGARHRSPTGSPGSPSTRSATSGSPPGSSSSPACGCPADALQDTGEEEGQGFKHSLGWLNVARVQTAARAVGLARGALEDAIVYCQQRVQFGEPIGEPAGDPAHARRHVEPRWRRRGSSTSTPPGWWTPASPPTPRRRRPSSSPPRWPSG